MIIRSRAPVRVSFAGGGTDVSPYTEEYGGCALNAAIRRYAWATLETRTDSKISLESYDLDEKLTCSSRSELQYDGHLDLLKAVIHAYPHVSTGFNLFLRSDFPPRSGLGGSASAFIATIGVFDYLLREYRQSSYEIAELAHHLEREVLKIKGGRQDQYAAVFGGINFIEFKGNDFVRVNPLRLPEDYLLEFEKHLVLVQLPEARGQSDNVIVDQMKRASKKDSASLLALHQTKEIAFKMKRSLLRGDFNEFGKLLDEAWEEKKRFSPLITNPTIDKLYLLAKEAGAIAGKITGAGGGGHMLFYCKPNKEQEVVNALVKSGAKAVDLQFDTQGLQVWAASQSF
jgi:D-glycero-alpha-D-manno-heptose-7-phosphate kinase